MTKKTPLWLLKLVTISLGFSGGFLMIELMARLLPASDYFPTVLPLECKNLNNPDLRCIFRRNPYIVGNFTKGKFPPFPINAVKSTNNIGQFSNIDLRKYENSKTIISIGDSYVEAAQVSNKNSFHGKLNEYETAFNDPVKSTAIAYSGISFPQYIINLSYVQKTLNSNELIVIFSICANDFDESFPEYMKLSKGGYFSSDILNSEQLIKFNSFNGSFKYKLLSLIRENSAISNYLIHNLELRQITYKFPFCKLLGVPCPNEIKYDNNIVDESIEQNEKRYNYGKLATEIFLNNVLKLRNTKQMKINTIFLVHENRSTIYDESKTKNSFFSYQRNYFISKAKESGFTVIDLDKAFRKDFLKNKKRFEFVNDGHWNSHGHKIVATEISKTLNLKKK